MDEKGRPHPAVRCPVPFCQVAATNELIAHYVDVISALSAGALAIPDGGGDSWPSELANRRQLATYLASLLDELRGQEAALAAAYSGARAELTELGELVGSRASVSKEAVYPRFHNIATKWLAAVDAAGAAYNHPAESYGCTQTPSCPLSSPR